MNDLYSASLCIVVHPKCFTIMWGGGGGSLLNHHQCAASTWMIRRLPQDNGVSALTTHQLQMERRESHRANQVDGDYWEAMIDKGQWWEFGQDTGVTPVLFKRCVIFNDHRESGPRFNVSSKRRCFLTVQCTRHYTGVLGPTQTTGWAPPAGLTNTSSNTNLVFPGGLPFRYWPGSTLLSSSGWPVLGCMVIWL